MGRKSAVGVANGNWRRGDYYWRAKDVERGYSRENFERMMSKKKMRASYWKQRLSNAMQTLRGADPNGWERWYDNDANVPADAPYKTTALLVEARVIELTGGYPLFKARARRMIFIWEDVFGFFVYSQEVGKKALYVVAEFDSLDAAESFLNGLPFSNCGYGVVNDLLPAPVALSAAH